MRSTLIGHARRDLRFSLDFRMLGTYSTGNWWYFGTPGHPVGRVDPSAELGHLGRRGAGSATDPFRHRSVSVVAYSVQKRAPSDVSPSNQGLVVPAQVLRISMHATVRRAAAVLASLGSIVALALAGGAGFRGW